MTLPLIYALNNATKQEKRHIIKLIKKDKKAKSEIQEVIQFVKDKGGIDYAQTRMLEYKKKAEVLLHNLPDTNITDYLQALIDFVIDRKK